MRLFSDFLFWAVLDVCMQSSQHLVLYFLGRTDICLSRVVKMYNKSSLTDIGRKSDDIGDFFRQFCGKMRQNIVFFQKIMKHHVVLVISAEYGENFGINT